MATARGASMSDTLMMLSTGSNCSMEEVAEEATSPLFFQLYHRGYDLTEMLVRRAEEAGFKAITLTVDTPTPSPKERDLRNRYNRNFEQGNFRGVNRPENVLRGTDESVGWNVNRTVPLTWHELNGSAASPAFPWCSRASAPPKMPTSPLRAVSTAYWCRPTVVANWT